MKEGYQLPLQMVTVVATVIQNANGESEDAKTATMAVRRHATLFLICIKLRYRSADFTPDDDALAQA
jgi:hypothetical protein